MAMYRKEDAEATMADLMAIVAGDMMHQFSLRRLWRALRELEDEAPAAYEVLGVIAANHPNDTTISLAELFHGHEDDEETRRALAWFQGLAKALLAIVKED